MAASQIEHGCGLAAARSSLRRWSSAISSRCFSISGGQPSREGILRSGKGAAVEVEGVVPLWLVRSAVCHDSGVVVQVVLDGEQDGAHQEVVVVTVGPALARGAAESRGPRAVGVGWVHEVVGGLLEAVEADQVRLEYGWALRCGAEADICSSRPELSARRAASWATSSVCGEALALIIHWLFPIHGLREVMVVSWSAQIMTIPRTEAPKVGRSDSGVFRSVLDERVGVGQAGGRLIVDDLNLQPVRCRNGVLRSESFVARSPSAARQRQHQHHHHADEGVGAFASTGQGLLVGERISVLPDQFIGCPLSLQSRLPSNPVIGRCRFASGGSDSNFGRKRLRGRFRGRQVEIVLLT